jgi:hypothetical protein
MGYSSHAITGMAHILKISDISEIHKRINEGWMRAFVYDDVPACTDGLVPRVPPWFEQEVISDFTWGVATGGFMLIPCTCADIDIHVAKIIDAIDSDPRTAGHKLVWIVNESTPIPESLIARQEAMQRVHLFYPRDFVVVDKNKFNQSEGVKSNRLWTKSMNRAEIRISNYCEIDGSGSHLGLLVSELCVPISSDMHSLPMRKLIKWSLISEGGSEDHNLGDTSTKMQSLKILREFLGQLDMKQQIMLNLVFS